MSTPMDVEAASQITITAKQGFKYGTLPFFAEEVPGMFVRIKMSRDKHMWTKIKEAMNIPAKPPVEVAMGFDASQGGIKRPPGGIYTWTPPSAPGAPTVHAKRLALYLKVDRLAEHQLVPLTNISSSVPTEAEINEYKEWLLTGVRPGEEEDGRQVHNTDDAILELPTVEMAEALRQKFETKVVKRILTDEDAVVVLALNEKLKYLHNPGSTVSLNTVGLNNDLVRRTVGKEGSTTQLVIGTEPGMESSQPVGAEEMLAEANRLLASAGSFGGGGGMGSPQQTQAFLGDAGRSSSNLAAASSQQTYGRDESSFEDSVRESNHQLQQQVAARTKEQEYLVNLTERNKAENRQWILTGEHYEKQSDRRFNLDEGKSLWEINDTKRKVLCDRYDDRKDKKEEDKKDAGAGAGSKVAKGPLSLDDPEILLEHCLSVRTSSALKKRASLVGDLPDILTEDLPGLSASSPPGERSSSVVTSPNGGFAKTGATGFIRIAASRPAAVMARHRSNSGIVAPDASTENIDATRGKRPRGA